MVEKSFQVTVYIAPNPFINDPEGLSIKTALNQLGFDSVEQVRAGRLLKLIVKAESALAAKKQIGDLIEAGKKQRLGIELVNHNLEVYSVRASVVRPKTNRKEN